MPTWAVVGLIVVGVAIVAYLAMAAISVFTARSIRLAERHEQQDMFW
jgi:hypothetical protein